MNRNAFRLASLLALAVGLMGMGPGSCGPIPEPCAGLDEQTCRSTEGCEPLYYQPLCDCAPCAAGVDCPLCDCAAPSFASCGEERPQPPPQDRCAGLSEAACAVEPGCQPVYFPGEPGTRCAPGARCLGDYAGCIEAPQPPPPPPCALLEEAACLARPECEPVYDRAVDERCGTDPTVRCGGGFAGCRHVTCPPVLCDMYCPAGFAIDERGCETCRCNPGCISDSDCAAGERCELPLVDCGPEYDCGVATGRCVPAARQCTVDADCAPGEQCSMPVIDCPPGAYCAAPIGTCIPAQRQCFTDGECAADEKCVMPTGHCPPDAYCAPAIGTCMPACGSLDESACLVRPDCHGVWGSGCSSEGCTPDRAFRCEDGAPACPDILCDLWCPNGFEHDPNGCEICSCRPSGCQSDADCGPGEICEMALTNCDPAGNCWPSEGVCRPAGCLNDSDCPAGTACVMTPSPCADGDYCESWGVCMPTGGCQSDADCRAGERCELMDCGPNADCAPYGTCRPAGCMSDGNCRAGEVCLLPQQECPQGAVCDFEGVCAPAGSCLSDADCGAGGSCIFLMVDCMGEGCAPGFGTCNHVEPGCASDADCAMGERCELTDCGPNADCAPYGACVPAGCSSDADCAPGQICQGYATCTALGCPPPPPSVCVDRTCGGDADCAPGTVCRPDPKDPCSAPDVLCALPPKQICQAPCAGLGETGCLARPDCSATYVPGGGWCGNDMVFSSCGDR